MFTPTTKDAYAVVTTALSSEKNNVLMQIIGGTLAVFLAPKTAENKLKELYKKAGMTRPNKENALTQTALHRVAASVKLANVRRESIINFIEQAETQDELLNKILKMIVKDFLPSEKFPLYAGNKFMPMLLLDCSKEETQAYLEGKQAAKAAKAEEPEAIKEEVAEESTEESTEESAEAHIMQAAPAPASKAERLEYAISQFWHVATSVNNTDTECLAMLHSFIDTVTQANHLLYNIHESWNAQGERVEFTQANQEVAEKLRYTLQQAALRGESLEKKAKRKASKAKLEELQAKFA